jgi:hypothetical protein
MIRRISSRSLSKLSHEDLVRFALFCANQITQEYADIPEVIKCHEVIHNWLEDNTKIQECRDAFDGLVWRIDIHKHSLNPSPTPLIALAHAVSTTYLEYDEDYVVDSCVADIAEDVVRYSKYPTKTLKQQRQYFKELCYIDNILEDIILKGK